MKKPICTVLLITYNHAAYLKKALNGVLEQKTSYPYVIHWFDDASTDGSAQMIAEFAAQYPEKIKPFLSTVNQGAQTNIWNAYRSVKTKNLILLETDDYWCNPEKLELQISALEKHPECSFCSSNSIVKNIGDIYLASKNGQKEIQPHIFPHSIVSYEDIYKLQCGFLTHISTRLVRTSCINFEEIKHKETFLFDASQFFYLLTKGKMYFLDAVTSVYVKTGKGTCSSAVPQKRLRVYWNAMLGMNEDTKGIFCMKVAQQLSFVSGMWLWLAKEKELAFQCRLPFLYSEGHSLFPQNTVRFSIWKIEIMKVVWSGKTVRIRILGVINITKKL